MAENSNEVDCVSEDKNTTQINHILFTLRKIFRYKGALDALWIILEI